MSTNNPSAWICTNEPSRQTRGRLKTHQPGSKIYLNDGNEFEIELFNPTKINVKAEITIDGKSISNGGLVIKSGERVYLECFPDNKKKFTFKTYEVDGNDSEVKDAISENGRVEIKYYNEKVYCNTWTNGWNYYPSPSSPYTTPYTPPYTTPYTPPYTTPYTPPYTTPYTTWTNSTGMSQVRHVPVTFGGIESNLKQTISKSSEKIETGQVSGGQNSDQQFVEVDMSFELFPTRTYSFQILPMSQKPISKREFKTLKVTRNEKRKSKLEELLVLTNMLEQDLITRDEYDKLKSELI